MRRVVAVALISLAPVLASAQMKVMGPQQKVSSSNPNVTITTQTETTAPSLDSARRITRDEAMKLVKQNKAVIVDVRSKESYDVGHIKGAISIPESQLIARLRELPPGKMIITYCAWQNEHTSARAVLDLNAHGVKNTAALKGGWNEWTALGLPTESAFKAK